MRYPVNLRKDGQFILVRFPDVPEAITQGMDVEDALMHGRDVLESALEFYVDARQKVPLPSQPKPRQRTVELQPSLSAKILLLNEMLEQKVRPAELARRLQVRPQEVTRLTSLRHTTKIDNIAAALAALGKSLEIRAV